MKVFNVRFSPALAASALFGMAALLAAPAARAKF